MAEVGNRDFKSQKAWNMYYLAAYRKKKKKKRPTSDLCCLLISVNIQWVEIETALDIQVERIYYKEVDASESITRA